MKTKADGVATTTVIVNTTIVDGKAALQLPARIEDHLYETLRILRCLQAVPSAEANAAKTADGITSLLGDFQPAKRKAAK